MKGESCFGCTRSVIPEQARARRSLRLPKTMKGGTLIVSRAIQLHSYIKRRFEVLGFVDVIITGAEFDGLNMIIREIKPRLLIIGSAFYDCSTPYMMKELLKTFPKLNIAVVSVLNSYTVFRATEFIFNGVHSYLSVLEGFEEFHRGLQEVRKGNVYISPEVQRKMENKTSCRFTAEELTPKHIEVIRLLGNGFTTVEAAETLGCSKRTVDTHKSDMYSILNVRNENELIRFALFKGIIHADELHFFPRDKLIKPPKKAKKTIRMPA